MATMAPEKPRTQYRGILEKAHEIRAHGERRYLGLASLLLRQRVLDVDGKVYPPTKEAVLALMRWHAADGRLFVMPMQRLAMELNCSAHVVSQFIKELEADGLVRRHCRRAPGRLYTTELLDAVPPPPARGPLTQLQKHFLHVLHSRMDQHRLVQTNEYELAMAVDVPVDTVMQELDRLRGLGQITSAVVTYGRPIVIKVLHGGKLRQVMARRNA